MGDSAVAFYLSKPVITLQSSSSSGKNGFVTNSSNILVSSYDYKC